MQAERANQQALFDGKQLNPQQLKDKLKATESQLITQKQEFQRIEQDYQDQLKVSAESNAAMKEDYDTLSEQFRKHSKMLEDQQAEAQKELKNLG